MSPPVSPQRRRDRGSGSLEPRGLTHSREAAFLQGWKSCNVDSFSNPSGAPRHLPYPRSMRGRGGHYYASVHTLTENTRISANTQRRTLLRFHFQQRTTAYLPTSQFPRLSTLNSQPSTLNHRPLTLNNKETPLPKQRRFPNNMKQLYRYFTITFFTTSPAFTI